MHYSVLLKYPESMTDGKLETYYTFVDADDHVEAVHVARIEAVQFQGRIEAVQFQGAADNTGYALRDFALLLVIEGHHTDYSWDEETDPADAMVTCRHCDTATPKAYAGPNRAGDGWIGECCWADYWEMIAEESA
jgi:hypothetical protein